MAGVMQVDGNWLRANTRPAWPEKPRTWAHTTKSCLDDSTDNAIVQQLIEELDRYGRFRDPIVLSEDTPWGKHYVNDGTHRCVALMLRGMGSIEVQYGYPDLDPVLSVLCTDIEFETSSTEEFDELFDDLFHLTRSIKVNEDLWVTCSFGSTGQNFCISWDQYNGTQETADLVHEACMKRLTDADLPRIVSARTYWEKEEDL